MKIVLDGVQLSNSDYTGAKGSIVEIKSSDTDGNKVTSVSQTYTLTGAAYNIVAASFIDNANGFSEYLDVKIFDDSCCAEDTLLFTGRLTSDNVNWCHGICSVDVIFTEYTTNTKQMDCLMSTLVYDNRNGFQGQSHPRMKYCIEMRPDLLQHIILIFGQILNLILLVITPIVAALSLLNGILQAIENVINAIPGVNINITFDFDGNSSTSLLQEYQTWKNNLNERIIGCARKHITPLVRSYIQNVCDICGVTFQSSILNSPSSDYYNTVLLNAPVAKGTLSDSTLWIDLNNPIYALDQFLDLLKPVFNAKWELKDGVLYFERKDFFNSGVAFVSYETLKNSGFTIGELCLEWRTETRPAYVSFKYAPDAVDVAGNEAAQRFNDIVEWNQPYSQLQSGSLEVQLGVGTPRFRDDGIDEDILGMYSNTLMGPTINQNNGVLILEKHLCFNPKLLIWDGDTMNGRVKKYPVPGDIGWNSNQNYNYPYMFNEYGIEPNTAYPSDLPSSALYQRFYSIDNPKLKIDLGKSFTFTFKYNCEMLSAALTNGNYVQLPLGENIVGEVLSITVNLDTKEITVQGNV